MTLYDVQPFIAAEKSSRRNSQHTDTDKKYNNKDSIKKNINIISDDEDESVRLNIFTHPHFPKNLAIEKEKEKQVVCLCYIAT